MAVYTIAQLRFTDVEAYRRYQRAFPAVFQRFRATLLAADESPRVVEGELACDKVVLIAFPDAQEAERFRNDLEYQVIATDRRRGADAIVLEVNGLSTSS
jgi:uncharacterized protein (DUF1330 family)